MTPSYSRNESAAAPVILALVIKQALSTFLSRQLNAGGVAIKRMISVCGYCLVPQHSRHSTFHLMGFACLISSARGLLSMVSSNVFAWQNPPICSRSSNGFCC